MNALVVDIISWIGLALCIGAFFVKDILMLRVTTLVGCALMTVYYLHIAVPQGMISNVIIVVINLFYLAKMTKEKRIDEQAIESGEQFVN